MPRFFFDTDDGKTRITDELGVDLPSHAAVERTTLEFLLDLSHVDVLGGIDRVLRTEVRNDQGATIYRASMMLNMVPV